jgi:hypothetical protein
MRAIAALVATAATLPFMVSAAPPSAEAVQLQQTVNTAIASGASEVTISAGVYAFNSAALQVTGARDLTLRVDAGTELWFELGAGLRMDNCDGVQLLGNGLVLDYSPLPFLQMTVQSVEEEAGVASLALQADPGSPDPFDFWSQWHGNPLNEFIQGPIFFSHTGTSSSNSSYPISYSSFSGIDVPSQMHKTNSTAPLNNNGSAAATYAYTGPAPAGVQAGDKLAAVLRTGFTLHVHNSTRTLVSNVTIHSSRCVSRPRACVAPLRLVRLTVMPPDARSSWLPTAPPK